MKIIQLETNHMANPMGFRMDSVVLSYKTTESKGKKSIVQKIEIAEDEEFKEMVLDTGWTPDIDSKCFRPQFSVKPECRYYWRASVRNDAGEEAVSEAAFFEAPPEKIRGKWICAPFEKEKHSVFMRKFELGGKKVKKARLYISGLGLYEAYLNGEKIGDEYLTPYYNDYNHRIQYQTYDVTNMLEPDANALGIMLGNGWYMGRFGYIDRMDRLYGDTQTVICELKIETEDGETLSVASDPNFVCQESPVLASCIYDGEIYDSRKEIPDFAKADCDTARWLHAAEGEDLSARLQPRLSIPVRIQETFAPAEVIHTPAGETVLDFGQEISGILTFTNHAPENAKVELQFGEILQNGNFYTDNLRSAEQKFVYYSNGKEERVRPRFTFYGFRYVKVEGVEDLEAADFTACVLHSDLKRIGRLTTDNEKVNRLIENAVWGQKGNFVDIPTDCPQRDERLGWTGDAQAFCATASFNMQCAPFYHHYMTEMLAEQKQPEMKGSVPFVVPDVLNQIDRILGKDTNSPESNAGSCAWGDAATIVPWTSYVFTGDLSLLETQYENMKLWTDYIRSVDREYCGNRHLWNHGFHFADWLALDNPHRDSPFGGTDPYFVASAYYLYSAELTAKAAEVLGKTEEAQEYAQVAEQVRKAMQEEYVTSTGRLAADTQTALVLALHFHIVPDWAKERTVQELKRKLDEEEIHLTTGFVGTAYLCKTLSENGLSDYAYTLLLNEDYPSWLYEVNMGATTVWERWNSVLPDGSISDTGMNSLNHYAYGAVLEWMYRYMGGLNPDEAHAGFKKFSIKPEPDNRFSRVSLSFDSPYGIIESKWERTPQGIRFDVTVPFDTEAEFIVPAVLRGNEIRILQAPFAGAAAEGELQPEAACEITDGKLRLEAGRCSILIKE